MKYVYDEMIASKATCELSFQTWIDEYTFELLNHKREKVQIQFVVIGDMGNLRTALAVAPWLPFLNPELCFLIGIAGAMSAEVKVGDVVVATSAKTFYPDKIRQIDKKQHDFDGGPTDDVTKEPPYRLDPRKQYMKKSFFRYRRDFVLLKQSSIRAGAYKRHLERNQKLDLLPLTRAEVPGLPDNATNPDPEVRFGAVFSGEMVVDSQEYIDFILHKDKTKAQDLYELQNNPLSKDLYDAKLLAVDMESLGFLKLIQNFVPREGPEARRAEAMHAFSVRGISDTASEKEALDLATNDGARRVAVINALRVTVDMIKVLDGLTI